MIKLLDAGFTRLRKSKAFWILIIFSIIFALYYVSTQYLDMTKYGEVIEVGNMTLSYPTMIGLIIAIFTSLFLGVEYSDGAIRNKVSIGHKRVNIYLTNLLIVISASVLFYVVYLVIIFVLGIPLFGMGTAPIKMTLIKILVDIMVCVSISSLCTFIAMLCSNKTVTAISTIVIFLALMLGATCCYSVLNTPPFIETATIKNQSSGQYEFVQEPNPKYPSEITKKVMKILLDINPTGQTLQMMERESKFGELMLYSLGIMIIFTGAGIELFNKKELK